jgi:hypothetical protein
MAWEAAEAGVQHPDAVMVEMADAAEEAAPGLVLFGEGHGAGDDVLDVVYSYISFCHLSLHLSYMYRSRTAFTGQQEVA